MTSVESGPDTVAFDSVTVGELLDRVAAPRPDPGGGAASALMLATGAALAEMVAGYSVELSAADRTLPCRLRTLRAEALALVAVDAQASAAFAQSAALPDGDPRREAAIVASCLAAADSALAIAAVGVRLLVELRLLDREGERRVHADVRVAAAAVGATLRASIANTQTCLDLAQTTGATTSDLLEVMRRLADLAEPLGMADALAATR